ncbi:hypothetical protein U9M48_012801 [Paspalum notatum var. saurae]|uniref:Fatty acyl-CoA reductase n=1 Tax=Paspalum notatum var. saurae TaxID=547442 RepID=A0AAQ3SZ71_PASNO
MVGTMEETRIPGYFKNKGILITGSTGFLGKILVEKILRVQPDVKRIYLPVRAPDAASAKKRVETEVMGTELFGAVRETHGKGFQSFIEEKVVALAGDVVYENLGVEEPQLSQMAREINVIVNSAATTNFYERYDVALDVNVMGVKHPSSAPIWRSSSTSTTAYVVGETQGVVAERAFKPGETLRPDVQRQELDIDDELRLARDYQRQVAGDDAEQKNERKAMKELGLARAREFGWPNTYVFTKALGEMMLVQQLAGGGGGVVPVVIVRPSIITSIHKEPVAGWIEGTRTIDAILIGYAKQNLSCFLADLDLTMDVIPGDMVVNAMMAAAAAHASSPSPGTAAATVYHATSSLRNPAPYAVLYRTAIRYFRAHPRVGKDGRPVRTRRVHFFGTVAAFTAYMVLRYRLPLEMLRLLSLLCCGLLFSRVYADLDRKYSFVMRLVDLYGPFALFKGVFDDDNMERLRRGMAPGDAVEFNFDPRSMDWDDYFYNIHIPGVMKYVLK